MDCELRILVEFYNEDQGYWYPVYFNNDVRSYEPINEVPLIKWANESQEDFSVRVDQFSGRNFTCGESITENHYMYSYLADVQNVYGPNDFQVMTPRALPKGFPMNASMESRIISMIDDPEDPEYGDNHDFTWYSAKEILDIDWNEATSLEFGYVEAVHLETLLDAKYTIARPLYLQDMVTPGPATTQIKFSRWRKYNSEQKRKLLDKGPVYVEVLHPICVLTHSKAVKELLLIAEDAYKQCPNARLLMWFED